MNAPPPSPQREPPILGRILLALVLMVGFYALAIGIAAGMLWISYAIIVHNNVIWTIPPVLITFAGIILWSVVPRPVRFVPPGPRLNEADHPELFQVIREVASKTGQAMPSDVYLVFDMNAMVAQHGGLMGIGSTRVMGIGLPVLQYLTVPELKAVLAHEFGHYHKGDTMLGPWIYATRVAMDRTIRSLGAKNDVLVKPFRIYGNLFLYITQAVSRRQEYIADSLAARIMGIEPSRSAMIKLSAGSHAFRTFFQFEIEPALSAGFLPPMTEGFQRFMGSGRVSYWISKGLQNELADPRSHPYATHPSLPSRLHALGASPICALPSDNGPRAITLMDGIETLERQVLASVTSPEVAGRLQPVAWDDMVSRVMLPSWRRASRLFALELEGLTIGSLHALSTTPDALRIRFGYLAGAPEDVIRNDLGVPLTHAIQAALVREGWTVETSPGEPVILVGPKGRLNIADTTMDVLYHKMDSAGWDRLCAELDMGAIELGGCGEPATGEDLWPPFVREVFIKRCRSWHLKRAWAALRTMFGPGGSGFSDGRLYAKELIVGPFLWDAIRQHSDIKKAAPREASKECARGLLPLRLKRISLARRDAGFLDEGDATVFYAHFTRKNLAAAAGVLAERYQGTGQILAPDLADTNLRSIPHWITLEEPVFALRVAERRLLLQFNRRAKLVYVDDYSSEAGPRGRELPANPG